MTTPDAARSGDRDEKATRTLPLTWAITLAFGIASFAGIVALTSDLAKTDALLTDAVDQIIKIDGTSTRGLLANGALPPTDAAVRESTPDVVATANSLRRADGALATLGEQIRTLADVLAGAHDPLVHIVTTADHADQTVERTKTPTGHILDTLRAVDRRTAGLGPALDRTLRISRSIEGKLHILGYLPGD